MAPLQCYIPSPKISDMGKSNDGEVNVTGGRLLPNYFREMPLALYACEHGIDIYKRIRMFFFRTVDIHVPCLRNLAAGHGPSVEQRVEASHAWTVFKGYFRCGLQQQ